MKLLAGLINLAWLVLVAARAVASPPANMEDRVILICILATFALNLLALYSDSGKQGWLSRLLERKAMEEKKKMDALNEKKP
jgi:hypothetical protein